MNEKRKKLVEIDQLNEPRKYLKYILDNVDLFIEWCHEGREPINFLITMSGEITEKDIKWAQESIKKITN